MKACNVFQIQRLSVNDGDGIRSTVFFKGCPLRCRWCANPESWSPHPELMFLAHKCTHCQQCVSHCPAGAIFLEDNQVRFASSTCKQCFTCMSVCPNKARQKMGESQSIDVLMQQLKKDFLFYLESGGGVTFSGGEPFYQEEALRALVNQCQNLGIATAVESCAQFNFTNCKDIIEKLDHIFFDLKVMDPTKHRYFTGIDNATILQNIQEASYCNDNIVIRMPAIREVNIDDENIEQLSRFLLQQTRIRKIELLPYHTLGKEKMEALGLPFTSFTAPTADELQGIKEKLTCKGLEVVSYS